jgi:hypothetical protein
MAKAVLPLRTRRRVIYQCTHCKHALRRSEIYYSDGVCRYCDNASAGIIVDYVKSVEIVPTLLGRLLS